MSKFDYKSEGELNSQYLLELIQEYLLKLLEANSTNGIVEDDFKINTKSNKFVRWFKHLFSNIKFKFKNKSLVESYNKVLSTKYVNEINDKIQIFLQTNVLEAKQIFDLKQVLTAINFEIILPEIDENRYKVIRKSQRQLLKALNDIKYLKNADTQYILYNSPVRDLKPFLSDKVSIHKVDYKQIQQLLKQYIQVKLNELTTFEFEPHEVKFISKNEDFYYDTITDNGIGEEVESYIRQRMIEKLAISRQDDVLLEEKEEQTAKIDSLLKRLKIGKIEQMMQTLIKLKTNQAQAKEVIDKCKDTINASTITNKATIFLIMDNLYYKLSKKCELLQQKIKLKLQLVDKVKMFNMLEQYQNSFNTSVQTKTKTSSTQSKDYMTGLYNEDDIEDIHVVEDDSSDSAEDEIVIEEEK